MTDMALDQQILSLDQKGGEGGSPTVLQMRGQRSDPDTGRRLGAALVTFAAVGLLLGAAFLLPASASASVVPPADWVAGSVSWTNGEVLCLFTAPTPVVTVSGPNSTGSGMWAAVGLFTERAPSSHAIQAVATLSQGNWTSANRSTEDYYELAFTGQVPILAPNGGGPLGTAQVGVDFILPAYSGSTLGPANEVILQVSLFHWSWQGAGDVIALTLPFAPEAPHGEHLVAPGSEGPLAVVSNGTGQTLEYLSGTQTASATPSGGPSVNLSVTPTVTAQPASANVTLLFGSAAGAFSSLQYSTSIGVVLPPTIAGIPTVDFVLVGGAAVVASLGIATGVRWVRRRPSDLEYVEEE
jgi:hypothetical protein